MIKNRNARISLVGAGPGNPDLMTIAAVKALKSADVVLYDALVDDQILKWTSTNCKKIFVGKRMGFKRYSQEEINYLMISNAIEYGHVVRLKGGDPFVFGRGSEEVDFATSFGVDVNIIPGITSAIAAPASIGIPVTKRYVSEGFWVITGTTKTGQLNSDITLAVKSNTTVIILMGMSKLSDIVSIYTQEQRSHTPIAIIQEAQTPNQKHVIGSIYNIIDLVEKSNLKNPAVIVIGDVVNHATVPELEYVLTSNNTNRIHNE